MSTLPAEKPPAAEARSQQAETPIETELRLEPPDRIAGGLASITHALAPAWKEAGAARASAALRALNQKEGFDCPGCAWPDPDGERTANEYCENGAKAVAEEATQKLVTPDFFRAWSVSRLSQQSDHWLGKQGRISQPMFLPAGRDHYQPISWPEAFALIARELNSLASPNEAVFYTSGRTSNEAAFLYQLFVRQFGTNNLPDCSNLCHESSGTAMKPVLGVGKGTVTLADFEHADAIFVIGQNPGTCHPRMLTHLQKAAKRGCAIVSVNPLAETGLVRFRHPQHPWEWMGSGTPIARLFLPVRVNGDQALFRGIMREMLEAEERWPGSVLDGEFIASQTSGFESFAAALRKESWERITALSGLSRAQLHAAAEIAIRSRATICCWAMGLTQHQNAVATIQEIVNFLLLRGNIGRPGAGACPVRGHSNVQGDRTVGINEKPSADLLQRLGREFGFSPPREHGYDTVAAIRAMHAGKARVLFALGGNFLSATPDTEFTARALQSCRLTAHVSTKLNRAHLVTGEQALILPCLGRTERDLQRSGAQLVSVENSMGIVHSSRGSLRPASEHLLSEPAIVAGLATATLGKRSQVPWAALVEDYDLIRERIQRVIPGFEDYNQRLRQPGGFYLPNGARERNFQTSDGRAHFSTLALTGLAPAADQFLLTTIRSHDQYNTTIYGLDDRYRGIHGGRRVVFLNPDDMRRCSWSQGELLDITSHHNGERRSALRFRAVPYEMPRGCAAAYFPEANVLVPISSTAEGSNTPTSKSLIVTLERSK